MIKLRKSPKVLVDSKEKKYFIIPGGPTFTNKVFKRRKYREKNCHSPPWWLLPVIPALWEAEEEGSSEVGSSRAAWQMWRNPVSTKNTKLARCGGACLYFQLLGRLRQENHLNPGGGGCSELRSAIALQPRQQEWNSISINKLINCQKNTRKCSRLKDLMRTLQHRWEET